MRHKKPPYAYFTRRCLFAYTISMSFSSISVGKEGQESESIPEDEFTPQNPGRAVAWMDQWMHSEKKPVGALHVARFADPTYFLLKPISWEPNADQVASYNQITVPVGFVTDFASIPQVFWSLLRPDGLYTYAAIVHDYLYWTQLTTKNYADNVFRLCMEDFSIQKSTIEVIYNAVKLFGQSSWDKNKKLRDAGEIRVLKRFPSDPRITWASWKQDSLVFE